MHNALSFQRVHQPKKHVLAHYHPETNMAYTEDAKGPLFKNMGKVYPANQDPLGPRTAGENRIWLLPEEAIYLLERGTVDIRWPVDEDDAEEEGLPMSLQGAYAAFLGEEKEGGLTFERYSVYAGLKRSGYTVHRAPSWDGEGEGVGEECFPPLQGTMWSLGLLRHAWRNMFVPRAASEAEQKLGPLVKPGVYRNYGMSLIFDTSMFSVLTSTSRNIPPPSHNPQLRPHRQKARILRPNRPFLQNNLPPLETRLTTLQEVLSRSP